jgi:uncharacterized membrane protein
MADLMALAYDDTSTAPKRWNEVVRLSKDLVIQPDAAAEIVRVEGGKLRMGTNQQEVAGGAI